MVPDFNTVPAAWHDATDAHTSPVGGPPGSPVTLRLRTRLRPRRVQVLELRHGEILTFEAHSCEAPYSSCAALGVSDTGMGTTDAGSAGLGNTEDWYAYTLRLGTGRTRYVWRLELGDDTLHVSTAGTTHLCPGYRDWYSLLSNYQPPTWVWESVFYQIFPDRFRRGLGSPRPVAGSYSYPNLHPEVIERLSPGRSELGNSELGNSELGHSEPGHSEPGLAALGAFAVRAPEWDEPLSLTEDVHTLYGGNLQGVQQALPYLEALGINALWLNPIFSSPSSHRYDTSDYRVIDPHLGGEAAFTELKTALHGRGMRLVLDGVFNHLGNEHALFQKAMSHPQAPERDFFTFRAAPLAGELPYHGFYDVPTMPKLDYTSEQTYTEFIDGPDSVTRHWLRQGIDGWRLDVAQGMGMGGGDSGNLELLRRLKRAAREEQPHAYVLGERFFDAEHALQDGQGEDGVMNYHGFALPVMTWFTGSDKDGGPARISTQELVTHLWDAYRVLPPPLALNQFNLLESHDIPRALFRLGGDTDRYLAALTLLMAYPGAPCLYYGSEIGLSQVQGNPMNCARATFPWDEATWNQGLLGAISRLVHLRRSSAALQRGNLRFVGVDTDCFALMRELGEEGRLTRVLCLVSRSKQATSLRLNLPPGIWRDLGLNPDPPLQGGEAYLTWQGTRLLSWESQIQQADAVRVDTV